MFASSQWSLNEPGIAFYEDPEDRSFKVSAITTNGNSPLHSFIATYVCLLKDILLIKAWISMFSVYCLCFYSVLYAVGARRLLGSATASGDVD